MSTNRLDVLVLISPMPEKSTVIQLSKNKSSTRFTANPVINGQMYVLSPRDSMKEAYKKAMSWIRFIRRYGNHLPMVI